jgi:hypothetical protein
MSTKQLTSTIIQGPILEVSSSFYGYPDKVTLGDNPLKNPPMEVVAGGTEDFLMWFEE